MKLSLLTVIAIVAIICIPLNVQPAHAVDWLSIQNDYFVVNYTSGHEADANQVLEDAMYARNVTMNVYPFQLDVKVKIFLYDIASYGYSPSSASASPTKAEMYFLTPSDVPQSYKSWVDSVWYQKNLVHEFVHLPTLRDYDKVQYYHINGAPSWITEGVAEYIAVFRTTTEIQQKYSHYERDMLNNLVNGSVIFTDEGGDSSYRSWTYIMYYVYDYYGDVKADQIFRTNASYVWTGINQALGVTPQVFEMNWIKWIYEKFNVSMPTQFLSAEELYTQNIQLQQNYTILSDKYNTLLKDAQSLNSNYSKLLSDYNSLQANNGALQSSYSALQTDYNGLKSKYESLQANNSLLLSNYRSLQSQYDALQTSNNALRADLDVSKSKYDYLQTNNSALLSDYDSLQTDYSNLQTNSSIVKADYDSLSAANNALKVNYRSLETDYDKLNTNYNSLKAEIESATLELENKNNELSANLALINELAANTNLMYGLLAATIFFIASTAYFAKRKTKIETS